MELFWNVFNFTDSLLFFDYLISYTFSKNHSCPLWTDYELTCYELEEANSLSHSNWIEIERQYKYIQTLQKILSDNDIPYPNEYDFD